MINGEKDLGVNYYIVLAIDLIVHVTLRQIQKWPKDNIIFTFK